MSQSLTIAILDLTPGWTILLEWIGAPYRVVHTVEMIDPNDHAAVIVNRHLWSEELEAVRGYLQQGGAILDVGRYLPQLEPEWFSSVLLESVIPEKENPLTFGIPVLDIHARGFHFVAEGSARKELFTFVQREKGMVGFLGFDPGLLMQLTKPALRPFPGLGGRHPAERVDRRSKGAFGLLVRRMICQLLHERHLPFLYKRPYPNDARTLFGFRIDTDYGTREQIDALYSIAQTYHLPMSWFVHTGGHTGWLERFAEFEGQEIAIHGARHRTYDDVEDNLVNIEEADRALSEAGVVRSRGFAAPNGIWHHAIAEAIDRNDFQYSSEFTLAYDALPFHPILPTRKRVNVQFYRALQIPIHPVSVGNLARVGIGDDEMGEYYRQTIVRKMYNREPLFFYHHPTHERWGVVEEIIEAARKEEAAVMSFEQYGRWWEWRAAADIQAWIHRIDQGRESNESIVLRSRDRHDTVHVEVIFPDGSVGRLGHDGEYAMNQIPRSKSQRQVPEGGGDRSLRSFSIGLAKRVVVDAIRRRRH